MIAQAKVEGIDMSSQMIYVCVNVTYSKDRENGGIKHTIGDVKTKKSNRGRL